MIETMERPIAADDVSLCPSDGKPCTLKCYRGGVSRPCDPVKAQVAK
jgi:hypothetical protein